MIFEDEIFEKLDSKEFYDDTFINCQFIFRNTRRQCYFENCEFSGCYFYGSVIDFSMNIKNSELNECFISGGVNVEDCDLYDTEQIPHTVLAVISEASKKHPTLVNFEIHNSVEENH